MADKPSVSPAQALDLEQIYDSCGITYATYEAIEINGGNVVRCRLCRYHRKHSPECAVGRFEAALAEYAKGLRAPSSATPEEDQRINEARAILFTDLLRYTSHRDNCRFYGEHRTHCAKWAGFHEHRYLDDTHPCTCGAGHPCTCGLQGARTALLKVLVSSQSVSRATSAPQESGEKKK